VSANELDIEVQEGGSEVQEGDIEVQEGDIEVQEGDRSRTVSAAGVRTPPFWAGALTGLVKLDWSGQT
jgi:DUF4097 and DUF4098 domain-containing protein YvlB